MTLLNFSMKDHYKILGVKEDASVDEIRERWIELMKQYHPDLGKGKGVEGKIEEINEAYQILKFSSTRMPYDLKRAHDRKKRRASALRIILTIAIPVLIPMVFILNILFFNRPQISFEQKVMTSSVHEPEFVRDPPQEEPTIPSTPKEMASEPETSTEVKTAKRDSREMVNPVRDSSGALNPAGIILKSNPSVEQWGIISNAVKVDRKEIVTGEPEPIAVSSPAKAEISENPLAPPVQMDQVLQANLTSQANQMGPSPAVPKTNLAPQAPVSSEEEIKQFYANYIERYTKKDIDGFLSCFSAKAVQNQRVRFDEIRKIYANFFNLSDELRYHMEGMKIAFNQNQAEVRAFYEVDQVVKKGRESKTWKGHIRWTLVREEEGLKILSLDYQQQKSP